MVLITDYRFYKSGREWHLDIKEPFQLGGHQFDPATYKRIEVEENGIEIWREQPKQKYGPTGIYIGTEEFEDGLFVKLYWNPISGGYGKFFLEGMDIELEVVYSHFLARAEAIPEGELDPLEVPEDQSFNFYYYNYLESEFPNLKDVLYLGWAESYRMAAWIQRCRYARDQLPEVWSAAVADRGDPFRSRGPVEERLAHFESVALYIGRHL